MAWSRSRRRVHSAEATRTPCWQHGGLDQREARQGPSPGPLSLERPGQNNGDKARLRGPCLSARRTFLCRDHRISRQGAKSVPVGRARARATHEESEFMPVLKRARVGSIKVRACPLRARVDPRPPAAPVGDLRRVFGAALPRVLASSSGEVLGAGPDVARNTGDRATNCPSVARDSQHWLTPLVARRRPDSLGSGITRYPRPDRPWPGCVFLRFVPKR